ncbi:GSCOCG00006931001-RA-CDS [Cotesia congregata]|uniref:Similar to lsm12a: Protein LSM12 homolog A (Danio rerio) n=1 Tax=Cotesia congregata TaxID=51543 RepID=A0A8J2HEE3_COTCN|nr:GSCOCG00006931001-RA-CDS [Cotesia congregata]CAG5092939.1 Similar to lsm12a: Protein LSM12 homolog A (Danio rerio) [Cotesia congregata]
MAGVSDWFSIGSTVACKTCYKKDIEGEVLAFDPQTKMLILKCPSSSGRPSVHDVNIVNLSLVSDVQVKREVSPTTTEPPQSLNLQRLNTRVRNQVEEKKRMVKALQAGVSPEGQKLFIAIAKTIQEITWSGQDIVVWDNVTIRPPYKVDNVHGNTESKPYLHVRKVVEKHMKDTAAAEIQQQSQQQPIQKNNSNTTLQQ